MAPPINHGARFLALRLERNRLDPRTRKMLSTIQRELVSNTWPALVALVQGRLARRELMIQQREQHLLADPDAEGGKWLLGMWAAQRRDIELLALLERDAGKEDAGTKCAACGDRFADLPQYLAHKQGCPGAVRAALVHPTAPDAAAAAARSASGLDDGGAA